MKETWTRYYLNLCEAISVKSKDPSRKIGAIIVGQHNQIISTGFNGFPIGVDDYIHNHPERYETPLKYSYTVHAEVNAIAFAARSGVSTSNSTLYCTLHPCTECAKMIVQSGITDVIAYSDKGADNNYNFDLSREILTDGKCNIHLIDR
jgi:dCMP deaminase